MFHIQIPGLSYISEIISTGKTGDNKGNILDDKNEEEALLEELGHKLGQWF